MMRRNLRFAVFTVAMVALMVTMTFLPASAQLSQWRSLNPTRDGTIPPGGLGPILYSVQLLSPSVGWAVGGTCDIYTLPVRQCDGYPGQGFVLFWDGVRWRQVLTPPLTGTLTSVFAVSASDVWAVGLGPTVIHWDGTSWVSVSAAVASTGVTDLFSVFMLPGGSEGWAIGDGTTDNIRWSGIWPNGAWSPGSTPNLLPGAAVLRAMSLSSSTFGWIVGSGGQVFKWDGAGWQVTISPVTTDLLSVFAIGSTDAWAVGAGDTMIRWNGASWTGPMVPPTLGISYRSIKMVSSSNGYIVGSVDSTSTEGMILLWNGAAWSIVRSFVTVDLNGLFLLPGGTVGAAVGDAETILHFDGTKTSPTSTNLYSTYFVASNDGWAVGAMGNIFRWDGLSWKHYETLPSHADLFGLFMKASSDAWAVGAPPPSLPNFPPTILRWSGSAWTVVSPPGVALGRTLYDVYMLSSTEGWAVGSGDPTNPATMLRWDGTLWASVPSGTPVNCTLMSVHMLSSNDGWAVGINLTNNGPVIVRWNGLAWSFVTPPAGIGGLKSIQFLNPNNGWAVGNTATNNQATIIHWDGAQWNRVPGPPGSLTSVFMTGANDGWTVGQNSTGRLSLIVHWDGLTWNVVATLPLPPTMAVALRSVFMVAPLDGWIVSDQGLILHYGPESVPGTTTSVTTVIETTSSTTASTFTPAQAVPGFPIESILAGLLGGLIALTVIRHRRRL